MTTITKNTRTPFYRIAQDGTFPKGSYHPYRPDFTLSYHDYLLIFDFAYTMAYGRSDNKSHHRSIRSGGSDYRSKDKVFLSAFEGKMGEFCVYHHLKANFHNVSYPDLEIYPRGKWDGGDLSCEGLNISVKTSMRYSQALFLEFNDYGILDGKAFYRHSNESQDIIAMSRINNAIAPRFKDSISKGTLLADRDSIYNASVFHADFSGYINNRDLANIIKNNIVIHKGVKLKGKIPMDVTNYYIFIKNMKPFSKLVDNLTAYKSRSHQA